MSSTTLNPFYLAWRQLTASRVRFLTAMAGSVVSATLILMQLGFQEGLYGAATALHKSISGEVVIVNPASVNILQMRALSPESTSVARGINNIKNFSEVATSVVQWRSPVDGQSRGALMVGLPNTYNDAIDIDRLKIRDRSIGLDNVGSILFDIGSRPELGTAKVSDPSGIPEFSYAINNRRVNPIGTYLLGAPLCSDGTILSSMETFNMLQRTAGSPTTIEVLTLQRKDDRSVAKTVQELNKALPADAVAYSKKDWITREIQYWDRNSPIGFIFKFGIAIGMLVGSVVIYQILYSDINDHIKEYATLKAIGYTDFFLLMITLFQGLLLSSMAIIPASLLSFVLLLVGKEATKVPLLNTLENIYLVIGLTLFVSSASALIASRKLAALDPADNF